LLIVPFVGSAQTLSKQVVGTVTGILATGTDPTFNLTANLVSNHGYSGADIAIGQKLVVNEAVSGEELALDITSASAIGNALTLTVVNNTGIAILAFPTGTATIQSEAGLNSLFLYDSGTPPTDQANIFNHNMIKIDGLLGGTFQVTQNAHGIADPTTPIPMNYNGTAWVNADADDVSGSLFSDAILVDVPDVNTLTFYARIYTMTGHGLAIGSYHYLSNTAGVLTTTSPTNSQPILKPIDANRFIYFDYRPFSTGGFNVYQVENLTVTITAGGGTATLSTTPQDNNEVIIYINGQAFDSLTGSGVTVAGTSVTFDNATMGIVLNGTDRVIAKYYGN